MTDSTTTISIGNCLGRTCLKWGANGELTTNDLALVMERLAQVDGASPPCTSATGIDNPLPRCAERCLRHHCQKQGQQAPPREWSDGCAKLITFSSPANA